MNLNHYLEHLQEGYFISNEDIYKDIDKFKSGEKNQLLIVGTAGSGKTTMGENLAKKYKVKWISIDSMWWRLKQQYFKNTNESKDQMRLKVYEYIIKMLKSNERFIMEGVDLLDIYYSYPKYRRMILGKALIVLGMSSVRAGIRAGIRNKRREDEGLGYGKSMYLMAQYNIKNIENKLNIIRKDILKTKK